ncbi:MAG TPA: hypothetical protein VF892_11880, partial [Pseudonocardiaceae bacterium]
MAAVAIAALAPRGLAAVPIRTGTSRARSPAPIRRVAAPARRRRHPGPVPRRAPIIPSRTVLTGPSGTGRPGPSLRALSAARVVDIGIPAAASRAVG